MAAEMKCSHSLVRVVNVGLLLMLFFHFCKKASRSFVIWNYLFVCNVLISTYTFLRILSENIRIFSLSLFLRLCVNFVYFSKFQVTKINYIFFSFLNAIYKTNGCQKNRIWKRKKKRNSFRWFIWEPNWNGF